MSVPHNPRAYPSAAIDDRFGGMTLLDWFAGQHLAGCAAIGAHGIEDATEIAVEAYAFADAMLAERAKRFPQEGQADG